MPKIVDHEKRREEIVQAAREVVLESGSAGLTLRRLAQQMGVANGALRLYFSTKSEVIEALFQDAVARTRADLVARGYYSQRGLAGLRTIYAILLPRDAEGVANLRIPVALQSEITTDPELAAVWVEAQEMLRDRTVQHLQEAIDDGEVDGRHPAEVTTYLLMNFAFGRASAQLVPGVHAEHHPAMDESAFEALLDAA